eukprot:COSAG04_NODE_15730_length_522_cov_1.094563_2_plen_59_part_01
MASSHSDPRARSACDDAFFLSRHSVTIDRLDPREWPICGGGAALRRTLWVSTAQRKTSA